MGFARSDEVKYLREQFPTGTRVELEEMDDAQAPPIGTKGTVCNVDDIGSLIVSWDNGSRLNVVFGVDSVKKCRNTILYSYHKLHNF